ncbi:MAG: SDR family oxidoreductase [bacterium]|jgi:NAD(P)-dependent dehydrogenase (short-subunit alcohol dehydrogenase family)|nr:SDR family oxidoreductase [bacterium]
MSERFRLDGRVAVITGAGSERGIGRAIATTFCEAGARVALLDRDGVGARRNAEALGEGALGVEVDVADAGSVEAAVGEVRRGLGAVSILVNSAGITSSTPLTELTLEEFDRMLAINVRGGYLFLQEVLPDLRAAGWGRVIWLSSIAGKQGGGVFGTTHYACSKAAVIGLCQGAARELGRFGITSNAIAPGLILTGMVGSSEVEGRLEERIRGTAPVGRAGVADDIAAAALYLASEQASYVTGEILDVNGGAYFD